MRTVRFIAIRLRLIARRLRFGQAAAAFALTRAGLVQGELRLRLDAAGCEFRKPRLRCVNVKPRRDSVRFSFTRTGGPEGRDQRSSGPSPIELLQSEHLLASHNVHNIDPLALDAIEDPTGRHDQFPIRQVRYLKRYRTDSRKLSQLLNLGEYSADELLGGIGFIERNVIGNCLQVLQRGFGPN